MLTNGMFGIENPPLLAARPYDLAVGTPTSTTLPLSFLNILSARSYEYSISTTSAVAGFGAWTALASDKIITGLSSSTQYWIKVRIVNGIWRGAASPVVTGTTASAGVTWTKTAGPAIQDLGFSGPGTFSSTTVNNPATSDTVVVMASTSVGAVTSVTIGGDSMTKAVESNTGANAASIWYRTGTIYTTPTIVVNGAIKFCGITVGYLAGATATPTDTDVLAYGYNADPQSPGSVTGPASGRILAVACSETGGNDPSWSNMTEDYDLASGSSWRHTSAYSNSTGAFTAALNNFNFAGCGMAIAAWGT